MHICFCSFGPHLDDFKKSTIWHLSMAFEAGLWHLEPPFGLGGFRGSSWYLRVVFGLEGIYGSFEDHSGGWRVMVWEGLFGGFFMGDNRGA